MPDEIRLSTQTPMLPILGMLMKIIIGTGIMSIVQLFMATYKYEGRYEKWGKGVNAFEEYRRIMVKNRSVGLL